MRNLKLMLLWTPLLFVAVSIAYSQETLAQKLLSGRDDPLRLEQLDAKEKARLIPELIQLLRHKDFRVRRRSANALQNIGTQAREAAPMLIQVFKEDADHGVKYSVMKAFVKIVGGKEAVPVLIQALKNPQMQARGAAMFVLEEIGAEAREAVPMLIEALKEPNKKERIAAMRALGNLVTVEEYVPILIQALKDTDEEVLVFAVEALKRTGPEAKEAVPMLTRLLNDAKMRVRKSAIEALGEIGPEAKKSVSILIHILNDDPNLDLRMSAFLALANLVTAKELLQQALKNTSGDIRGNATQSLLALDPKEALPLLIHLLKEDRDIIVRFHAMRVFDQMLQDAKKIDLDLKEAVPTVIQFLKDENPYMREMTVRVLGNIGSEAKEVVAPLQKVLKEDTDPWVRISAARALIMTSGAKEYMPILIQALQHPEQRVRNSSVMALGDLGAEAREAVPLIIQAFKEGTVDQSYAMHSLKKIVTAKEYLPILIHALNVPDGWIRESATHELGKIGPEAKDAIPILARIIKEDIECNVRFAVLEELGKIATTKEALPILIEALKDRDSWVLARAIEALGEIGSDAKDDKAALTPLLLHKDRNIRTMTAWALIMIQMEAPKESVSDLPDLSPMKDPQKLPQFRPVKDFIPIFNMTISDKNSEVRRLAAQALGDIGSEAQSSLPLLMKAILDPDENVRKAVNTAIIQISGQ